MKFNKFLEIKEKSEILNESMSYDTLTIISVAETLESLGITDDSEVSEDIQTILDSMDVLDEGAAEAAGNLWKTIKGLIQLGGIGKKYQKALVDEAAEEMDFARKKKASDSKEETEGLKKAHEAKKNALKDQVTAIAEKMDNIAKTEWLKARVKKIKIEARIAKNKILLKIANKEEAKELQVSMQKLNQDLTTTDNELEDYQSENKDKVKNILKEKKEEIKSKISELKDKLKSNKEEIDALSGNESEESDKHQKLADLKTERGKLLSELIKLKETYNHLEEDEDEKYDIEANQESLETLAQEVKDHKEKAGKEESEEDSETKPEKGEGEEETKPEKGEGEEETKPEKVEDEPEEDENIKKKKAEIADLKDALAAAEENPKKNKDKIDILKVAIKNKEKQLEKPAEVKKPETKVEDKPETKVEDKPEKKASSDEDQLKHKKEQLEKKISSAEAKIAELEKKGADKEKIAAIKKNVDAMYDKLSELGESFSEFDIDEMLISMDSILEELNSLSSNKFISFANFLASRNK